MMSPDSSQSSSDSQAAWLRLNESGVQFVPYVVGEYTIWAEKLAKED